MDDFVGVLYIELLDKSLNRCIIDWKCFSERVLAESNKTNLRTALIQYCRGQREIFLKLKVLFDMVKYQKTIDRLLQKSVQYDQYIENSIQDISRNICVIENNIMPSPNVSLGVDLLNSFSYTRMPSMVGEVSKSSVDNTIPIMKMDPESVDLCLNRLKIHYYALFRLSKCFHLCKIQFDNGKCQFTREHFFQVELLYDFNQYQITKLKLFVNNNEVFNIINVMNYMLNYNMNSFCNDSTELKLSETNTAENSKDNQYGLLENMENQQYVKDNRDKNIFDVLYSMLNDYIGKMVMKYLYKQAINYCNAKFIVFQYNLENNDDQNWLGRGGKDEVEQLLVECFVKYKYKNRFKNKEEVGFVMKFVRHRSGDVDLNVDELDIQYHNIHDYHLDHWIQVVSSELESYQFRVLEEQVSLLKEQERSLLMMLKDKGGEYMGVDNDRLVENKEDYVREDGDNMGVDNEQYLKDNRDNTLRKENKDNILDEIWVNRMNGSLNLKGYRGEFSLSESKLILKLQRVVGLFKGKFSGFSPFNLQMSGSNHLVDKSECPLCVLVNDGSDVEMEDEVDNNLVDMLLGGNKHILYNVNNNLHLCSFYLVYPTNYKDTYNNSNINNNNRDNMGYDREDTLVENKESQQYLKDNRDGLLSDTNNDNNGDRDYMGVDKDKELNNLNLENEFQLVLNVLVHDYVVFKNNLLVLDPEDTLLGTVELKFLYHSSMSNKHPLLQLLIPVLDKFLSLEFLRKPNKQFKDKRYFVTEPLDMNSKSVVFKFTSLNFSLEFDMNGSFQRAITNTGVSTFCKDNDPDLTIKTLLETYFD